MSKLISGKEALIALANGEDVEFYHNNCWSWVGEMIVIDHFISDKFKFRLKPRTITLKLEIPAPFEPKVGDYVYFLCSDETKGYAETTLEDTPMNWGFVQFGAWRTEEEIKQVVAALREVFKVAKD